LKWRGVGNARERTPPPDAAVTALSVGASSKSTARGAAEADAVGSTRTQTSAAAEASSFTKDR
jgi:hypothetical protein